MMPHKALAIAAIARRAEMALNRLANGWRAKSERRQTAKNAKGVSQGVAARFLDCLLADSGTYRFRARRE
jgi:hypothetical protein